MTATLLSIPAEAYHADDLGGAPSLSASIVHLLYERSPAHAFHAHPRLNPDFVRAEESKFDRGTVAHALLLQGEKIIELVDAKDWRTRAAQDARAEARRAGKVAMLAHHWDEVQAMVKAARRQLPGWKLKPPAFKKGTPEQTLVWEENGVECRALIDWLHDDHSTIDDYKTTGATANPEQWCRSTLFSIGADIQVAWYLRGMRALTGKTPDWRYVVQETSAPYALSVVGVTPAVLEVANAKIDLALEVWARCLKSGEWPGYPTRIAYAELPGWEAARWLEREALEEDLAA